MMIAVPYESGLVFESGAASGGSSGGSGGSSGGSGGSSGGSGKSSGGGGKSSGMSTAAILGGVVGVGGMLTGVSNSVLNWVDAFCVTDRCKNAKKAAQLGVEEAQLGVQAQQYAALAAIQNNKAAAARTTLYMYLGMGALALGAVYIIGRK